MANWILRAEPHTFRRSSNPHPDAKHLWLRLGGDLPTDITGDPDSAHWKVVGENCVRRSLAERQAIAQAGTRAAARANVLDAVTTRIALADVRARLAGAGKATAQEDARLSALDTRIASAIADHPAAP